MMRCFGQLRYRATKTPEPISSSFFLSIRSMTKHQNILFARVPIFVLVTLIAIVLLVALSIYRDASKAARISDAEMKIREAEQAQKLEAFE